MATMFAAFRGVLRRAGRVHQASRVLRAGAVLLSMTCAAGCPESSEKRDGRTSSKTANSAAMPDGYPNAAWPKERDDTAEGSATDDIVTVTRTFATHITTDDTVNIALRFHSASGPMAQRHGGDRLNTSETWMQTEFVIRRGDEEERLTLAASPRSYAVPIWVRPFVLRFRPDGLEALHEKTPWKVPSKLLGTAGPLTIQLQGDLKLDDRLVPYSTKEFRVTIALPSQAHQSQDDLGQLARAFVQKVEGNKKPLDTKYSELPVETTGNLLVFRSRLQSLKPSFTHTYVDIAMTPAGKVVAAARFVFFSCVAVGTRVATPGGTVNVEDLRFGDRVWSMDLARNKQMLTHVVAVGRGKTDQLVQIDGLRVTPTHPLWIGEHGADGRWVVAGDVARGNVITLFQASSRAGARRPIARYETESRNVPVYDLSVAWPHNFFAEGILVHNKSRIISTPDAPWMGLFARGKHSSPRG